jgi:transcriptional regulator with XRE-family HTH domain
MHVNSETFLKMLKQRGMTQTAIAEGAGVGIKTVGRIKRGQALHLSSAQKIAHALNTTVEVLVNPPSEVSSKHARGDLKRFVADLEGDTLNNLMLTSIRYKVHINTLIMYAPLLFSIVAELSLKQRKDRLEDWSGSTLEAIKKGPRYDARPSDYSMMESDLADIESNEWEAIERRELAGNSGGTYYNTDYATYKEDEEENLFLQFLEDLAVKAGQDLEFYGSSMDSILYNLEALLDTQRDMLDGGHGNLARFATPKYVLYRDIPKNLLAEELVEERTSWLASYYGGANGDIERALEIWDSDHSDDENDSKALLAEENKNE